MALVFKLDLNIANMYPHAFVSPRASQIKILNHGKSISLAFLSPGVGQPLHSILKRRTQETARRIAWTEPLPDIPPIPSVTVSFHGGEDELDGFLVRSSAQRLRYNFYHPQRSCGKAMFLHMSVTLSRGVSASVHAGIHPPGRHPPGQTPPEQTPPRQTPRPGRHNPHLGRHPLADGYYSERYASYWNVFLLFIQFHLINLKKFQ